MAKTAAKATNEPKGYKGHVAGSRKGKVHEAYDRQGGDAAFTLAQKLGLKPSTARAWMAFWKRTDPPKVTSKPPKKPKAAAEVASPAGT
jgi:hypothetical protein